MVQLWLLNCPLSKGPVVEVNSNKRSADWEMIMASLMTKSTPKLHCEIKLDERPMNIDHRRWKNRDMVN